MFDLTHLQCPVCHHTSLHEITDGATTIIQCAGCQERYDVVRGIPFLGRYGEEDIPGLIEIAANAENYSRTPEGTPMPRIREHFEQFENIHAIPGHSTYMTAMTNQVNRYIEWVMLRLVLAGIDVAGKAVLDVGAGTGYGSYGFFWQGAQVTCFDYSPILCAQGLANLPQARWFCGVAPILPFTDESFDIVIASEALHHIRDVSATLEQMLRLLKPGGYLLTLGDTYRLDSADDLHVARTFEHVPSVLMGVNEGLPRLSEFFSVLEKYQHALDIQLFSYTRHEEGYQLRAWTFDDIRQGLTEAVGSLSLRVQKKKALAIAPIKASPALIGAAEYDRFLDNQTSAMAHLVNLLPERLLDLPFNDWQEPMFRLMNGWKLPGAQYRTAYRRARVYIHRSAPYLRIKLFAPYTEADQPTLVVLINGQPVQQQALVRGLWTQLSVPLPADVDRLTVEIRLDTTNDDCLFHVQTLEQTQEASVPAPTQADIVDHCLLTMAATGLLPATVGLMLLPYYEQNIAILNQLRALQLPVQVVVAPGQEAIFAVEPGIKVAGTYDHPTIQPTFVVARHRAEATDLTRGMTTLPRYMITPQGMVTRFKPRSRSVETAAKVRQRVRPVLQKLLKPLLSS
jgi:ubiquinone/menaquinone biosynthesis C-methylase UbiE